MLLILQDFPSNKQHYNNIPHFPRTPNIENSLYRKTSLGIHFYSITHWHFSAVKLVAVQKNVMPSRNGKHFKMYNLMKVSIHRKGCADLWRPFLPKHTSHESLWKVRIRSDYWMLWKRGLFPSFGIDPS
ncbi:hypothetical protein NPIL_311901 [Nephila pilipes]|uniref:Uncharacterized protein n=1 Tax=Nephila pilipes TaxID=299642 RepID=A0A8X6TMQ1_NEPPI|nr:hypothetical protein NPIL_311901 [Nephila pilipes]